MAQVIVPAGTTVTAAGLDDFVFTEDFDCGSLEVAGSFPRDGQLNRACIKILSDQISDSASESATSQNSQNINNLGAGVAANTALMSAMTALPTNSDQAPLTCGVGTGGYSKKVAISLGCAAKLSDRLAMNVGGSNVFGGSSDYGGGTLDSLAVRAGLSMKLGTIEKSSATNKQLQKEVEQLEGKVKQLENAVKILLASINQGGEYKSAVDSAAKRD